MSSGSNNNSNSNRSKAKVLIVRHGNAENNVQRRFVCKMSTLPIAHLTELGVEQAAQAGRNIFKSLQERDDSDAAAPSRPICIYHSPLHRTVETAETIARILQEEYGLQIRIRTEPDLIEVDHGILDGLPFSEAGKYQPSDDAWDMSGALNYKGETVEAVCVRAQRILNRSLLEVDRAHHIVFVTHGNVARYLLRTIDEAKFPDERLQNAEFKMLDRDSLQNTGSCFLPY